MAKQLCIDESEAQKYVDNYYNKFKGILTFKNNGAKNVEKFGYVLMNKFTGHKMFWWDINKWKKEKLLHTQEFWEDYKANHKGSGDNVCMQVKNFFQTQSKWEGRMVLNAPTQGEQKCPD